MSEKHGLPILSFASGAEWADWLAGNAETSSGVWLEIAKKGSDAQTVTYREALDSALCFGWIDGQKGAHDSRVWLQKFTPRGRRSRWSRINRDRAEELIAEGLMQPAGSREIKRARADGRWEQAYDGQQNATVPEDLERALDRNPHARAFFAALDRGNRYAILYRIQEAKRPETRERRIAQYVQMLSEHRKLHP